MGITSGWPAGQSQGLALLYTTASEMAPMVTYIVGPALAAGLWVGSAWGNARILVLSPLANHGQHLRHCCELDAGATMWRAAGDFVLVEDFPVFVCHVVNSSFAQECLDL